MKIELLPIEDAVGESPDTTSFIKPEGAPMAPFMTGIGPIDYMCGHCGFILAERLEDGSQIQNIHFKCPRCSGWSRTRN